MRTPTENQYATLRALGNGAAGLSFTQQIATPLLRHGWVTAEAPTNGNRYYQWVRITPDGLRALALAVERYGLPDLGPRKEHKPEPPLVQKLRSARDEARNERDEAQRESRHRQVIVDRVRRALDGKATF